MSILFNTHALFVIVIIYLFSIRFFMTVTITSISGAIS